MSDLYQVCDGTCPSCKRMGYEHHYVSVEPFTLLGPISPKSYLAQQLGLRVGKRYIIVEVPDE